MSDPAPVNTKGLVGKADRLERDSRALLARAELMLAHIRAQAALRAGRNQQ